MSKARRDSSRRAQLEEGGERRRRTGPATPCGSSRGIVPAFALLLLVTGCAASFSKQRPDFAELYGVPGAAAVGLDRNPVIVVPGLTGSRLVDGGSGQVVWGVFASDSARPARAEDLRLLALPMREGEALSELRDEVRPDGVLDRLTARLLGIPIHLRAYFEILRTLGLGGYRDETLYWGDDHFTCFQFDFDWRRDNVEGAQRLHEFIVAKRRYVQEESRRRHGREMPDLKFDLVAHSMGALLVRYYLRYGAADLPLDGGLPELTWEGARHVERVILVGPPNAGTLESVEQLVNGKGYGPLLPHYPAALLGTFPSGYQMLPRQRHGMLRLAARQDPAGAPDGASNEAMDEAADPFDPELWQRLGWGLASPDAAEELARLLPGEPDPAARRRIALDHQAKALRRARHFAAALDRPGEPPAGLSYYLIAGDTVATPRTISVEPKTGRLEILRRAAGDGKVLRSSALMDERLGRDWTPGLESPIGWDQVMFLGGSHLGMTGDPLFTDNLLYWLLEQPR